MFFRNLRRATSLDISRMATARSPCILTARSLRVVGTEFESMIDRMPRLTEYQPELRRYLLDFPRRRFGDSTDFLYWQVTKFGLKPTMRISHLVIRESAEESVVASKLLYASHYFWTAIELRVLVADPSRGTTSGSSQSIAADPTV